MSDTELLTKIAKDIGELKGQQTGLSLQISSLNTKVDGICDDIKDLPVVKLKMTNHLAHHESNVKYFWRPLAVSLTLAGILYLLRVIFHII